MINPDNTLENNLSMRFDQGRPPDEPITVSLRTQYPYIDDINPIADERHRSSPMASLRPNERRTHTMRLSLKHRLIKPDDFQPLGDVPYLVGIAKLSRKAIAPAVIGGESEIHHLATGQEERLTGRRLPRSPTLYQ